MASASGPANTTALVETSTSNGGGGGSFDEDARRKELRLLFRKQQPKFLRNRLANLNLAQDGLLPALVERLTEATLLLERGVAPTTHAQATGEEVVVRISPASSPSAVANKAGGFGASAAVGGSFDQQASGGGGSSSSPPPLSSSTSQSQQQEGMISLQQGAFASAADVNDPLRQSRHRESLEKYQTDLAARAAPTQEEAIAAARKEYLSRTFQNQFVSAHRGMEEHEAQLRGARLAAEETAQKIKDDQDRQAREKVARAQAEELARQRRIQMHGGVDPLQPVEKDRSELIAAIREEIDQ